MVESYVWHEKNGLRNFASTVITRGEKSPNFASIRVAFESLWFRNGANIGNPKNSRANAYDGHMSFPNLA